MNIESIKRIEGSSMWERITAHPLYLGNKILEDGAFKSMYLFFSNKIDIALVTEWSEAGKLMGGEEIEGGPIGTEEQGGKPQVIQD